MIISNSEIDYELDIDSKFEFTEGGPCLLLDGDPIAYSSAAACDKSTHIIKVNGITVYSIDGGITDLYQAFSFKDYRDFNDMLDRNPHITYEKLVESDDPANMMHTIKAQIRKIIKRVGAGSLKLYLTDGDSNFRITEEIATVLKYKGNRSSESKPQMLGKAREYMVEHLDAIMCVGLEADDQLSIEHREAWNRAMEAAEQFYCDDPDVLEYNPNNMIEVKAMELTDTVLGTIDKDIKMCAGKFINPDQDLGVEEIYPLGHLHLEIKKKNNKPDVKKLRFSGLKGFYAQLLLGDSCDNISGVYFCGDTRVNEVLSECKNEEELFKATLREIYEGFHREHLKTLTTEIESRLEKAIESGKYGKDNPSNRSKVKKKIKDNFAKQLQYGDKFYYHWSEYLLNEDGTVSNKLKDPENARIISISPVDYMIEVARLVYMLDTAPNEDGTHLWTPPNQQWVDEVVSEYDAINLLRIEMAWQL